MLRKKKAKASAKPSAAARAHDQESDAIEEAEEVPPAGAKPAAAHTQVDHPSIAANLPPPPRAAPPAAPAPVPAPVPAPPAAPAIKQAPPSMILFFSLSSFV